MPKLMMTVGLPGSGKSHWASEQLKANPKTVVVNKDAIRRSLELTGWVWSHKAEAEVITQRDRLIMDALEHGRDVICSDTNFGRKHKIRLEQIARENGADFVVKSFTDVPLELCIERDRLREGKAKVGEDVIRGMAKGAGLWLDEPVGPAIIPVTYNETLMPAIICDLDGTLALFKGQRSPYDASKCGEDKLNPAIYNIILSFNRYLFHQIILCSGRQDTFMPETIDWLRVHHVPHGPLYMRKAGDYRKDWIVKYEIFNQHIRGKYNVKFVLDDRDQVVRMWRELGLTTLQVADGNF